MPAATPPARVHYHVAMLQPHEQSDSRRSPVTLVTACIAIVLGSSLAGCSGRRYDPAMATRAYPEELGQGEVLAIQAFRDGPNLTIVNASLQHFENVDLWLNRRYMYHLESLGSGHTTVINLNEFYDAWGETPVAGGFFRTQKPTPSVLLQIQLDRSSPLVGVICLPSRTEF
ncbi:MAG: hypothetical protein MK085_02715 [Phycisphaerales bacterium]|nr:hypothetical protein [Phycisphaerales bacterium]